MKKISILISVMITLTILSSCTINQKEKFKRTITVNGTGQVELESDIATITLAVITRNYDVLKAVTENSDRMTKVRQALLDSGITKTDITTKDYSIYQETSYQNGKTILGQYNVSNNISIIVRNIEDAGKIIDLSIKNGANSLSSLTYSAKNRDEAVKQARILAIKQAEETASILSTSSGMILGKPITIEEVNGGYYPRVSMMNKMNSYSDAESSTPVSSGKESVTVTVNVVYELQ